MTWPSPTLLARASATHPWITLTTWAVLVLVAGAVMATMLWGNLSNEMELLNEPDSTKGAALLERRMPQPPTELVMVTSDKHSVDEPAFERYVGELTSDIRGLGRHRVARVDSYYENGLEQLVGADRRTLLLPVTMTGSLETAQQNVSELRDSVQAARQSGFRGLVVGNASVNEDFGETAKTDLERGEVLGLPLALIVLLVVFGAVVAAALPIVLGIVAIVAAFALTALLGEVATVSMFAANMITTMGLAVGIDYTLFIVSRYREELAQGRSVPDAVAVASGTAGRAVFFSGLTVVLALFGLLIVPNTLFTSLGAGAIFVVAMAVLGALTLLPAALRVLGTRVDRLRVPYLGRRLIRPRRRHGDTAWARLARRVMRRPALALLIGVGLLLLAASPVTDMRTAVSSVEGLPDGFQAKKAFQLLDRHFSGGMMNPVQIVVDGPAASPSVKAAVKALQTELAGDDAFGPAHVATDESGTLALIQTPIAGTSSGELALAKVRQLRSTYIPDAFQGSGARVYVTGASASTVDETDVVNGRTPWVIGVVLTLSFALLLLAFRSVVVSATAIVMNLLSVGAAFGLVTLVFEKGVGLNVLGFQRAEAIDQWVPLFMFSILFGLSMDYQVFLISRIKEHYDRTGDNDAAIVHGVSSTAGIITGAALIMVAVFSGFAAGQLVMLQELGFGLGVAVLLDATVVRILLVPAAMTVLGRANWYLPSWLGWLPRWTLEDALERPGSAPDTRRPAPAPEPALVPHTTAGNQHAGAHPVPVPAGRLLHAHRRVADDSRSPEY